MVAQSASDPCKKQLSPSPHPLAIVLKFRVISRLQSDHPHSLEAFHCTRSLSLRFQFSHTIIITPSLPIRIMHSQMEQTFPGVFNSVRINFCHTIPKEQLFISKMFLCLPFFSEVSREVQLFFFVLCQSIIPKI